MQIIKDFLTSLLCWNLGWGPGRVSPGQTHLKAQSLASNELYQQQVQRPGPATDCSLSLTEWFRAKEVTSLAPFQHSPFAGFHLQPATGCKEKRNPSTWSNIFCNFTGRSCLSQVLPARRSFGSLAAHFVKRIAMWFIIKMKWNHRRRHGKRC